MPSLRVVVAESVPLASSALGFWHVAVFLVVVVVAIAMLGSAKASLEVAEWSKLRQLLTFLGWVTCAVSLTIGGTRWILSLL